VPAYLVDDAGGLHPEWFAGKKRVGISAGASAPELLVQGVVARLREMGADSVTELRGIRENVMFRCPGRCNNKECRNAPSIPLL